jgi:hypothetical protein
VQQKATSISSLFETDCKAASWALRTYLDRQGDKITGVHNAIVTRVLNLRESDVCPLIVLWILTVEKTRRKIPVYNRLYLTYNWVIRKNGESLLEDVTTGDDLDGLELRVTHLEPTQNGFSMDYGFPQVDLLKNEGFENVFQLGGHQWAESFKIRSAGDIREQLSNGEDPEGIANYS